MGLDPQNPADTTDSTISTHSEVEKDIRKRRIRMLCERLPRRPRKYGTGQGERQMFRTLESGLVQTVGQRFPADSPVRRGACPDGNLSVEEFPAFGLLFIRPAFLRSFGFEFFQGPFVTTQQCCGCNSDDQ